MRRALLVMLGALTLAVFGVTAPALADPPPPTVNGLTVTRVSVDAWQSYGGGHHGFCAGHGGFVYGCGGVGVQADVVGWAAYKDLTTLGDSSVPGYPLFDKAWGEWQATVDLLVWYQCENSTTKISKRIDGFAFAGGVGTWLPGVSFGFARPTLMATATGPNTARVTINRDFSSVPDCAPWPNKWKILSVSFQGLRLTYTPGTAGVFPATNWPLGDYLVIPGTVPGPPTAVSASTPSAVTAVLRWAPPSSDGGQTITGYRVGRDGRDSTGTGPWSTVTPASARSLTFSYLKPDTDYTLTVQAINQKGAGEAVSVAVHTPAAAPPSAPTQVTAGAVSPSSARLSWQPPAQTHGIPVTGYRVARDGTDVTGTGQWSTVVSAAARSHLFTYLRPGDTYTLTVTAITAAGEGAAGQASVAMPKPPPSPRTATGVDPLTAPALVYKTPAGRAVLPLSGRAVMYPTDGVEVVPLAGARLTVQFVPRGGSAWRNVASVTTDASGRFARTLSVSASGSWRAVYAGDTTHSPAAGAPTYVGVSIPPLNRSVQIARIRYNPPGADTTANRNGEYVLFVNASARPQAMTGYSIRDREGHAYRFPTTVIAGNGQLVLFTGPGRNTATSRFWGMPTHVWNNTGVEIATLRDAYGRTVDTCRYTGGTAGWTRC